MTDTIYVIAPFSRPKFFNNLIDNFNRQLLKNKKLIIIENGNAIGTCAKNNYAPYRLLTSEASAALAKNAGIEFLKNEFDNVFWTTFDDDDYYGPNYLNELFENRNKAEVIGKYNNFIKLSNNSFYELDFGEESKYVEHLYGYTISAWSKECEFFPDVKPWGEDNSFLANMQKKGAKLWATSKFNSCIIRHDNHTWQITDKILQWSHFEYMKEIKCPNMYDVINNKVKFVSSQIERPSMFPEDIPFIDRSSEFMESMAMKCFLNLK